MVIEPGVMEAVVGIALAAFGGAKGMRIYIGRKNGNGNGNGSKPCPLHDGLQQDVRLLAEIGRENAENISYIKGRIDEALKK